MHVFNPVFYDEYNLMNYLDFAVMKTAKLYPDVLREEIYLLFDLNKDPKEQFNLAGTREATEIEKKLRCSYDEWKWEK